MDDSTIFDKIHEVDLKKTMEPSRYVGCAPAQVDAFLGQVVKPILEEYREVLGEKAEINV